MGTRLPEGGVQDDKGHSNSTDITVLTLQRELFTSILFILSSYNDLETYLQEGGVQGDKGHSSVTAVTARTLQRMFRKRKHLVTQQR